MKISASDNIVAFDDIDAALASGKHIAGVAEAVMDEQFIERSRHDWCWLSGEHVPQETGWYEVDRRSQKLIKIADAQASRLAWHQRLFVYASALNAAAKKSCLALYIGDEYEDGRLSGLYVCGPDVLARVAQK